MPVTILAFRSPSLLPTTLTRVRVGLVRAGLESECDSESNWKSFSLPLSLPSGSSFSSLSPSFSSLSPSFSFLLAGRGGGSWQAALWAVCVCTHDSATCFRHQLRELQMRGDDDDGHMAEGLWLPSLVLPTPELSSTSLGGLLREKVVLTRTSNGRSVLKQHKPRQPCATAHSSFSPTRQSPCCAERR